MVSKQAAIVLLLLTQKLPAAGRGEREREGEKGRVGAGERKKRRIKNFKFAAIPATKAICIIIDSRLQPVSQEPQAG